MVVFIVGKHKVSWGSSINMLFFSLNLKESLEYISLMLRKMKSKQYNCLVWKMAAMRCWQRTKLISLLSTARTTSVQIFICWSSTRGIQKLLSLMRYQTLVYFLPISNSSRSRPTTTSSISFRIQLTCPIRQKHFSLERRIASELRWSWFYMEVHFQHRTINSTCLGPSCWRKVTAC